MCYPVETERDLWLKAGPWLVTDNSGSFTGRGWRLSAQGLGFEVYPDSQLRECENECVRRNIRAASNKPQPEQETRT